MPPKWGHFFTLTERMAVAILEEVNNHADAEFKRLGRVAQSVGHLTRKSRVLGSIPSLATYFRFSFRFFQEGQLSVTGESMCTKYWLTREV